MTEVILLILDLMNQVGIEASASSPSRSTH